MTETIELVDWKSCPECKSQMRLFPIKNGKICTSGENPDYLKCSVCGRMFKVRR